MQPFFFENEEQLLLEFLSSKKYSSITILCDSKTNGFCISVLENLFPNMQSANLLVFPEGENHKNWEIAEYILSQFMEFGLDKNALLINLGGGVVSDIGGFCASIFKRGIDFINFPTTLLAMCDASIGGKNGINFLNTKNQIGLISLPETIYINPIFLNSLPERQLKNGIVEMLKHELLFDKNALQHISACTNLNEFYSLENIKKNVAWKNNLVKKDLQDAHERQQLNFGHSLGHAIESHSHTTKNPLLHGEAILLGMLYELQLSKLKGFEIDKIYDVLFSFKEKFYSEIKYDFELKNILPFLFQDKKNTTEIKMSLLVDVANCNIKTSVSITELEKIKFI